MSLGISDIICGKTVHEKDITEVAPTTHINYIHLAHSIKRVSCIKNTACGEHSTLPENRNRHKLGLTMTV